MSKNLYHVENWPLSKLKRDPDQPRKQFNQEDINNLAESIKQHGIIKNIEIRPDGTIISGENRFRAAKLAGLKEVPCRVLTLDSDSELRSRQLHENLHVSAMTPMDLALSLRDMRDREGITYTEVARRIGKPTSYVFLMSALLELPAFAQKAVNEKVSETRTLVNLGIFLEKNPDVPFTLKDFLAKFVKNKIPKATQRLLGKRFHENPGLVKAFLETDFTKENVAQWLDRKAPSATAQINNLATAANKLEDVMDNLSAILDKRVSGHFGLSKDRLRRKASELHKKLEEWAS